jgi:glutaredoxin
MKSSIRLMSSSRLMSGTPSPKSTLSHASRKALGIEYAMQESSDQKPGSEIDIVKPQGSQSTVPVLLIDSLNSYGFLTIRNLHQLYTSKLFNLQFK